MLFFPVFAKPQPRRTLDSFSGLTPAPCPLSPNSHGIISFTDSHPLNSVVSYRYKNIGGRGVPPECNARIAQNTVAHPPFFSTTCAMLLAQPLSFDNLPFSWGVWGSLRLFDVPTSDPQTFQRVCELSSFLSYSCTLFCTHQNHNSFVFKRFRTLCTKHPGGGGRYSGVETEIGKLNVERGEEHQSCRE
jgi:hypothetical protein